MGTSGSIKHRDAGLIHIPLSHITHIPLDRPPATSLRVHAFGNNIATKRSQFVDCKKIQIKYWGSRIRGHLFVYAWIFLPQWIR